METNFRELSSKARSSWLHLPECAIIGSTPEDRLSYATKIRRLGISCSIETCDSKRDRMHKRAVAANMWGKGGVYDLDDPEDRAWLDRADLNERGV